MHNASKTITATTIKKKINKYGLKTKNSTSLSKTKNSKKKKKIRERNENPQKQNTDRLQIVVHGKNLLNLHSKTKQQQPMVTYHSKTEMNVFLPFHRFSKNICIVLGNLFPCWDCFKKEMNFKNLEKKKLIEL